MRTEVTVITSDVVTALKDLVQRHNLGRLSELPSRVPDFEIAASVDLVGVAKEAGMVDPDDHHQEVMADIEPNLSDLRDGLRALVAGDWSMASIMLVRAFGEWPEAARAAEEIIGGRTVIDRRQRALALVA